MTYLTTMFPDPDVLLALPPEELGPIVLGFAREARGGTNMLPADVDAQVDHSPADPKGYPHSHKDQVQLALSEAWNWLRVHGLVVPADNDPGSPWVRLRRRGARLLNSKDFTAFRQAAAFPKALLHPAIADEVWLDLARGDYETAIFRAFKGLEVAVRDAAALTHGDSMST